MEIMSTDETWEGKRDAAEGKVISEQEGILCRDDDGWFKLFLPGTKPGKDRGRWWSVPIYGQVRLEEIKRFFPDIDVLIPPGEGLLKVVFKLEVK